ncbi:4-diphosphocytidyl-2C-methyl-D-erythritol kinase [Kocuria coralli]|uniref:4-diphosphocytidyl-2-C-methyl-D-erythritol kinase n=1 Tax=Kocuria coralli TaxID=1461025 RepID=A0A5J5L0L3_9MICC|nr:4-diphosphocytidyl-2C-methyl-D-erythritol kinase [Kocuria coralli]KAA9394596.1 4-diphosphocytidyl-2C-methyl-D-erythritol kinase [Kocuria coralli]
MSQHSFRVEAPGKVNLFFAVGPRRPDGYHGVASLYIAVDVAEAVTATFDPLLPPGQIECTLEVVPGSLVDQQHRRGGFDLAQVPMGDSNLAVRAARKAVDRAGGLPGGVRLHIEKAVPVAGGMGGGSADAAAALQATTALIFAVTGRETTVSRSLEIARELGADVPFAMTGGAAVGTGTGADLSPVPVGASWPAVLIADDGALATPAVFARLDALRADGVLPAPGEDELMVPDELLDALAGECVFGVEALRALRNDLQAPALDLAPHLAPRLEELRSTGAVPMVSGSGPTLIALVPHQEFARDLAGQLQQVGAHAVPVLLG